MIVLRNPHISFPPGPKASKWMMLTAKYEHNNFKLILGSVEVKYFSGIV